MFHPQPSVLSTPGQHLVNTWSTPGQHLVNTWSTSGQYLVNTPQTTLNVAVCFISPLCCQHLVNTPQTISLKTDCAELTLSPRSACLNHSVVTMAGTV
ncbi:hypothetical protein ACOMHN_063849 [Nucella lapillus]